ncbi:MAG: tetratricopeptide repeat protein [Planctomycetes bacterium]|nr:tetratricopeptide repeat protein [Planctomycetota bacterium]
MHASSSLFRRRAILRLLALGLLACGLPLLSGCEMLGLDSPSMDSLSWSNPFSSKDSTAKADEASRQEALVKEFMPLMVKARNLEKERKYDESRTVYQKLVAKFPERPEAFHRLGVVADHQKRHREAQSLYTQALALKPGDPQILNDLGYCYFLQGQLTKAESALAKAVDMSPSKEKWRNNLGLVYGYQGRYDEALQEFRHAGSDADAWVRLAFIKTAMEDAEGAKECFRLALADDPMHEEARRNLRSFEEYDRLGPGAQDGPVIASGGNWVPYQEGSGAGAAQPVSHDTAMRSPQSAANRRPVTDRRTDSMIRQSQAVMSQRMKTTSSDGTLQ